MHIGASVAHWVVEKRNLLHTVRAAILQFILVIILNQNLVRERYMGQSEKEEHKKVDHSTEYKKNRMRKILSSELKNSV